MFALADADVSDAVKFMNPEALFVNANIDSDAIP